MATVKYKVNTNETALNLRAQANTDSEVLASIPKGAIVEPNFVMPVVEGWTAVSYEGKNGYVSSQYLIEATEEILTNNSTNEENEKSSSDKWLIAGCVVAALGAVINILI